VLSSEIFVTALKTGTAVDRRSRFLGLEWASLSMILPGATQSGTITGCELIDAEVSHLLCSVLGGHSP